MRACTGRRHFATWSACTPVAVGRISQDPPTELSASMSVCRWTNPSGRAHAPWCVWNRYTILQPAPRCCSAATMLCMLPSPLFTQQSACLCCLQDGHGGRYCDTPVEAYCPNQCNGGCCCVVAAPLNPGWFYACQRLPCNVESFILQSTVACWCLWLPTRAWRVPARLLQMPGWLVWSGLRIPHSRHALGSRQAYGGLCLHLGLCLHMQCIACMGGTPPACALRKGWCACQLATMHFQYVLTGQHCLTCMQGWRRGTGRG